MKSELDVPVCRSHHSGTCIIQHLIFCIFMDEKKPIKTTAWQTDKKILCNRLPNCFLFKVLVMNTEQKRSNMKQYF